MLVFGLCFVKFGTSLIIFFFLFFVQMMLLFFIEKFEPLFLNYPKNKNFLKKFWVALNEELMVHGDCFDLKL